MTGVVFLCGALVVLWVSLGGSPLILKFRTVVAYFLFVCFLVFIKFNLFLGSFIVRFPRHLIRYFSCRLSFDRTFGRLHFIFQIFIGFYS